MKYGELTGDLEYFDLLMVVQNAGLLTRENQGGLLVEPGGEPGPPGERTE